MRENYIFQDCRTLKSFYISTKSSAAQLVFPCRSEDKRHRGRDAGADNLREIAEAECPAQRIPSLGVPGSVWFAFSRQDSDPVFC